MRTKEQRQERIVEILSLLHQGGSFEEAKRLFNAIFMRLYLRDRSTRSIIQMKNMDNLVIQSIHSS